MTSTIVRHASAAEFLAATEAFRAANPLLTNIMGSVASGVVDGRTYDSELWLTVHDDGRLVGMAMRTAPWNLAVSAMPDAAPPRSSVATSLMWIPLVPGVNGPQETVDAVVRGIAPGPGPDAPHRHDRRASRPHAAAATGGVPGAVRAAQVADMALLVELAPCASPRTPGCRRTASRSPSAGRCPTGALWIWEDAGDPGVDGRSRPARDDAERHRRPHRAGLHAVPTCVAGGSDRR